MPKITEMFAFVMADAGEDDEGITAFTTSALGSMPMVGADMARAESLMETAQQIADHFGKPISLRKFTRMEEIRVIEPRARRS